MRRAFQHATSLNTKGEIILNKKFIIRQASAAVSTLTVMLALAGTAHAASFDIDLAGWQAYGGIGESGNGEQFVNIGAGSLVTGFEYSGLSFQTQNNSYLNEFVLSVNKSDGSGYLDLSPSTVDGPGTFGVASGAWGGNSGKSLGEPFTVGNDGLVWVMIYDIFPDPGVNAQVLSGTLRVIYQPVPEPGSYALFLAGLGVLGWTIAQKGKKR